MAIFETGAVTSVPNLLDALAIFAAANGWTVNSNAIEGSGRRVHLQKGSDVFINLRALVNEFAQSAFNTFGSAVSGLAINGSTGYDSGQPWYKQPGYPNNGVLSGGSANEFTARMAGMMGISGAIPAYYFHARGDMIYVWIEYATGLYMFMGFGKIGKYGSWTGGTIFFANGEGHSASQSTIGTVLVGNPPDGLFELSANSNGYLYMDGIDGLTGWLPASSSVVMSPAMPKFFSSFVLQAGMAVNIANQFNSLNAIMPCEICVTRDGAVATWSTNTNFSIEGYLPDIHFVCTRSLLAAQQLDDGSGDTFRIYPFRQKAALPGTTGKWFGVAIKEN
jgi:hypothetical protein